MGDREEQPASSEPEQCFVVGLVVLVMDGP